MAQVMTLSPEKADTLRTAQAMYDAEDFDGAYSRVLDLLSDDPSDAQALTLAVALLKKANKTAIAYSLAKRATEIRPDRSETWLAFGHCAQHLWRLDEAMSCYRKALQRAQNKTQKALYLNNIGSLHIDSGEFDKAEPYIQQSLEAEDGPLTRHNLGLVRLAQRRWKEAWPLYSSSVGTFNRLKMQYAGEPVWDGTKGQKVVVYGEQGLGDEICFASMVPDVCEDASVVLDCDKRLEGLFRRSFPKAKVYGTRTEKALSWDPEDRAIDASIAIAELGKFYRNADADFPSKPYLTPCPVRSAGWRSVFKGKLTIGVAWTGGTWLNGAVHRKCDLSMWKPLFDSIDANWVSLQYKDASEEIKGTPVVQYPWATLTKDYDDTAALVSACDLIVSVPTTVVHLAGALGVPTISMQSSKPCWKFAGGLAWHPKVQLIDNKGDWAMTMKRTIAAVQEWQRG